MSIGGSSATWDTKGNITSEPLSGRTYGYSSENLLTSASGSVTLGYDPALRLYQVAGASTTRFAYDGLDAIAEYDGSNALQRRFVFGPGIDQPIVQYEGTGTTTRRFLSADERGSIISATDSGGSLIGINTYDEYGKPGASNIGRFQYTGQKWLPEIGAYDYKARIYLPQVPTFAQLDPIWPASGSNGYDPVGGDPVNFTDPLGLQEADPDSQEIVVNGRRLHNNAPILELAPSLAGLATILASPAFNLLKPDNSGPGVPGAPGAPSQPKPPSQPKAPPPHKPPKPQPALPPMICYTGLNGVPTCSPDWTKEQICYADAQMGRGATYGGGATTVVGLRSKNPIVATSGAALSIFGVAVQLDYDMRGC